MLFAALTATFSQELRVVALNEPLDKVINRLGVEVSFDSRALSKYKVSIKKTFSSPQQALDFILSDKPFECQRIGDVFVIVSKPVSLPSPEKKSRIPKTEFKPVQEELPEISTIQIGEIVISAPLPSYSPKTGSASAEVVMDHRAARFVPGSGDNSVFNLLRMMPGVRAVGEPSDELIVWGSTAGESRIVFDGIPLFGMRGFNDNISFINPYLVKRIKLMKGGYEARYGNQIGAIAEISGIDPETLRPSVKATISTLTANLFASTPVSKRAALSVAFRRTFYDLYQSELLNPYNGRRPTTSKGKGQGLDKQPIEMFVTPAYSFTDLNLNLSGTAFENDSYRIALYGADDRFGFTAEPTKGDTIAGNLNSRQIGASASYNKVWSEKSQSRVSFSYSRIDITDSIPNLAQDVSFKLSHHLSLKNNRLEAGVEFDQYVADKQSLFKPSIYLSDRFTAGNLLINVGLRTDLLPGSINLQPRFSASYSFAEQFIATASWGLYNQYLNRLPVNTKTLIWGISDHLKSMHTVAGISYRSPSGFSATIEGYIKNTKNALRIVDQSIVTTDVDLYGGDLFLTYDFPKGTLFGSYSLSDVRGVETGHEAKVGTLLNLKPFVFSANYVYGRGFTLLDLYGNQGKGNGKGNGNGKNVDSLIDTGQPYSRFDISATYRLRLEEVQLQAGISLINLFNTQNLKYSFTHQSKNDPITLYTGAMPFTPMLFFEFIW
ncbi:hypothetical protein MASR1M31_06460 [Porphyromonadaceae bacterium]